MPVDATPAGRGRRLGLQLRLVREEAGFNGETVAARIGVSPSKVSRFENGHTPVRMTDLEKLIELYELEETRADQLRALARAGAGRRPPELPRFGPGEEERAETTAVQEWAPGRFPLLLSVRGYSAAVLARSQPVTRLLPSAVSAILDGAHSWQRRLRTTAGGLRLSAVIDESVLYRQHGTRAVMTGQLERVTELASWPAVDFRVLRLAAGAPDFPAFSHLSFGEMFGAAMPDTVLSDRPGGTDRLTEEEDVMLHQVAFDRLQHDALTPGESADLLAHALKRIRDDR